MMGWYDAGWSSAGMVAMAAVWLVLVGAAVSAVVALTRRSDLGESAHSSASWRTVLDGRFAAGELTEQEYLDARRLLEEGGNGPSA